ncbi:MAG: glycosyltransferase [Verrucomicrobiae bacterium]|nr:glycosyltransferase [Verrucomicrobiae bacterium]
MKQALLVLTRNPFVKPSGRKKVIRTIIESLQSGGCRVDLAILDEDLGEPMPHRGEIFWLKTPGVAKIMMNTLLWPLLKGFSLNECIYFSRSTKKRIEWLVELGAYDLIVGDMVRTAPLLEGCGATSHIHLDLDDLLSARYAKMCASGEGSEALLGYFEDRLPRFLLKPMAWGARRLLKLEGRKIARREVYWANFADSVSLVSSSEATALSREVKTTVEAMPMAVDVKPLPEFRVKELANRAVFVGGMRYQPNLDAVRFYCDKVVPLLVERGLSDFCLDVIGEAPVETIGDLTDCKQIHFRSFVDDLDGALAEYPMFLAPLVSGETGVKTKILEAFAAGLPLITSKFGTTGLMIEDGVHFLKANSAVEFVDAIEKMLADPGRGRGLAMAAHEYVERNFSTEVLAARWKDRILSRLSTEEGDGKMWQLTLEPSVVAGATAEQ